MEHYKRFESCVLTLSYCLSICMAVCVYSLIIRARVREPLHITFCDFPLMKHNQINSPLRLEHILGLVFCCL